MPGTVAVYLPLLLASGRSLANGPALGIGIAILTLGAAIYAWCLWDFAVTGRGTPAPIDAPKTLIVRGLYRYSRNPMYVGVLTTIAGWALLYRSPTLTLYALLVGSAFHLVVVLYEERRLAAEFGQQYHDYQAGVARWLPNPWRGRKVQPYEQP